MLLGISSRGLRKLNQNMLALSSENHPIHGTRHPKSNVVPTFLLLHHPNHHSVKEIQYVKTIVTKSLQYVSTQPWQGTIPRYVFQVPQLVFLLHDTELLLSLARSWAILDELLIDLPNLKHNAVVVCAQMSDGWSPLVTRHGVWRSRVNIGTSEEEEHFWYLATVSCQQQELVL